MDMKPLPRPVMEDPDFHQRADRTAVQQGVPLGQARQLFLGPVTGRTVDQWSRRDQGRDGADIEMFQQAETE